MVYACQLKKGTLPAEEGKSEQYAAKVLRNTGACYRHHIVKFKTELSILQVRATRRDTVSHSVTQSLSHSVTHSSTHSITHSITHS
eukprot:3473318-Pyramimonas_sp.AAC.1